MLKATKSKWFERLFTIYNRNLLKRRFHSLNVIGLEKLAERNREVPTIIYANHSSWWDGLVAFQIIQEINSDFYVMMEETQLKNLQLFRKLGAFSVVREKPRSAVESINYSVSLLNEKRDIVLCIFPQGEIQPNDIRPIIFFNGISRIVEKTGDCQVANLVMKYEFLGDYKPDIFVKIDFLEKFNSNEKIKTKELTQKFSNLMTQNLDSLNELIINNDFDEFVNLLK